MANDEVQSPDNLARRRLIQHPRISDALRRVAGLFLVGFGIRLGLNG